MAEIPPHGRVMANYDWKKIRKDFELTKMSYRVLAEKHGVKSPSAIMKNAKKEGWKRKETVNIKRETKKISVSKHKKSKTKNKNRGRGRPLKFETVEELEEACACYFLSCLEVNDDGKVVGQREPYTITGLALALDTSRQTLINYEDKDDYFDTIKRAKLMCENYAEKILLTGKNQTGAIFALKNYNWSDKREHELTGKDGGPIETKQVRTQEDIEKEMKEKGIPIPE